MNSIYNFTYLFLCVYWKKKQYGINQDIYNITYLFTFLNKLKKTKRKRGFLLNISWNNYKSLRVKTILFNVFYPKLKKVFNLLRFRTKICFWNNI